MPAERKLPYRYRSRSPARRPPVGDFYDHSAALIATEIGCEHICLSPLFDCAFRIRGRNNRSSQPQYIQKSQRGIREFGGCGDRVDG